MSSSDRPFTISAAIMCMYSFAPASWSSLCFFRTACSCGRSLSSERKTVGMIVSHRWISCSRVIGLCFRLEAGGVK